MQSTASPRQNPTWVRVLVPIVVVVIGLRVASALGGDGLPAGEARDKAVQVLRQLDPTASISDWTCPDDSIAIDRGTTTYCSAETSSLGPQRFAIVGLGDDRYSIRLR